MMRTHHERHFAPAAKARRWLLLVPASIQPAANLTQRQTWFAVPIEEAPFSSVPGQRDRWRKNDWDRPRRRRRAFGPAPSQFPQLGRFGDWLLSLEFAA